MSATKAGGDDLSSSMMFSLVRDSIEATRTVMQHTHDMSDTLKDVAKSLQKLAIRMEVTGASNEEMQRGLKEALESIGDSLSEYGKKMEGLEQCSLKFQTLIDEIKALKEDVFPQIQGDIRDMKRTLSFKDIWRRLWRRKWLFSLVLFLVAQQLIMAGKLTWAQFWSLLEKGLGILH